MPSINQAQIAELKELMEDAFEDLVSTYVQDSEDKIKALGQALEAGEADAVGSLAHSLKGSSLNICAQPLSEIFKEVEDLGKAGDLAPVAALIEQAVDEFGNVRTELNQML